MDNVSQEYLATEIAKGLRGDDIMTAMDRLKQSQWHVQQRLQTENGSEFTSEPRTNGRMKTRSRWTSHSPESLRIIPLSGHLMVVCGMKCLDVHGFLSLKDAQEKIEHWRQEYNHICPHSSLNNQTLTKFARNNKIKTTPLIHRNF